MPLPVLLALIPLILPPQGDRTPLADYHQHLFSPAIAARSGTDPIDAAQLVQLLDAARIRQALVLSLASPVGKPEPVLRSRMSTDRVKVMAESKVDAIKRDMIWRAVRNFGQGPWTNNAREKAEAVTASYLTAAPAIVHPTTLIRHAPASSRCSNHP